MIRLSVDIGGTFTDVVLDTGRGLVTTKVLTTYADPALGVMQGIDEVLVASGTAASDIDLVLHGTTLATNALIERRGAHTALLTTEGHRDIIEMAFENRFEQYDVNIDRPSPLVPRPLRIGIVERMAADGSVLLELDEESLRAEISKLVEAGVDSIAIGYLHSYQNNAHEVRTAEIVAEIAPGVSVSMSSDVCPEIREYERLSTTVANAYVKPLMADYLASLESQLHERGVTSQILLMTSGGGLTTLESASRYPIRLVESGPAGGAMLAAAVAKRNGLTEVLSFDMGGTTAKLCLIDDAQPLQSRAFEVDRSYRFKKGSGLPIRIPVVEMVEIGAGGGSIAGVDGMHRLLVGPESAGSEPGPACYGRGGQHATVTDADAILGRLSPAHFGGGKFELDLKQAESAVRAGVSQKLETDASEAAYTISEVVEENMASAARAHASEWGLGLEGRTMIAFGGAAPLHAVALAKKLKVNQVIVPQGAGVGSAIGFLLAPIKFEVVRSDVTRLSNLSDARVLALAEEMRSEASEVIRQAVDAEQVEEHLTGYMRYAGQGYEVAVPVELDELDAQSLKVAFEAAYEKLYGRTIPDMDVEVLSWSLSLQAAQREEVSLSETADAESTESTIPMFDGVQMIEAPIVPRSAVSETIQSGPALIVETQTSIVVPTGASFCTDGNGDLFLTIAETSK